VSALRITINMPEGTLAEYRAIAEKRGTTVAAVMREVLSAHLSETDSELS
jgi:hypothetical protein